MTATYERGAELGCPDCACDEPHVCPFLLADAMPEPQRSRVLEHLHEQFTDDLTGRTTA